VGLNSATAGTENWSKLH